ncbi:MAG: MetQ/NlpA family ABC transporter substrate-binding protein [Bdellovibrionota bacterium]
MFLHKALVTICFLLTFSVAAFAKPIKVGIIAGPSVDVLDLAKKLAKKKYNLDVEPVVFTDYIMPNEAVNSGDIDMNMFQTVSYLKQSIAKRNYKLISIGNTFIYPMGIFSKKIKTISELKEKGSIAIPNDPSNEGRALLLLDRAGLIKLRPDCGEFANLKDITSNPKNLKISTLNSSQIPRVIPDVDAVVLNNDFVNNAGFKPSEALVHEDARIAKPYINIIVAKESQQNNEDYKKFVSIMNSHEVLVKTMQLYPGAVKAW